MAEVLCYKLYASSTSPHSSHRTTLLNTKILSCTVSQKSCAKFILLELPQIATNLITKIAERIWLLLLEFVLEVYSAHTDTSAETTTPLIDSTIDYRLIKAYPLVDQTHFKFVDVSNSGSVNFLLQYTPDAIVEGVQIRLIRWPQCWRNEVWHPLLQESDGVACSMRRPVGKQKTLIGIAGIGLAVASGQGGCRR